MNHKDKISKCACGYELLICIGEAISKIRGTVSKCSSSNLRSSFTDSNPPSRSADSNSNLPGSFTDSSPITISNCKSNSNSDSNSNAPFTDSSSIPSSSSKLSPTYSFTNTEKKFDITNKVCNKCNVIKQITSFEKKSICKECSSSKVKCEYCCSSIISFSRLRGHIKTLLKI